MFANGTQLQLDAGIPTTIDEYWEGAKEKQTAGFDQYDWYPEWVKGKTYANTKFVDSAINDFGAKFQQAGHRRRAAAPGVRASSCRATASARAASTS